MCAGRADCRPVRNDFVSRVRDWQSPRGGGMCSDVIRCASAKDRGRSSTQHAIEFVDQEIDSLIGVTVDDSGGQVRPRHLDMPFRCECMNAPPMIAGDIDSHANDVRLVAKQAFSLLADCRFDGRGQPEMNAPQDKGRGGIFGSSIFPGHGDHG